MNDIVSLRIRVHSTQTHFLGQYPNAGSAPFLSWMLASWTKTASGSPSVSVKSCSFRPFIFLLPSMPRSLSTCWVVLALLESMMPRLGLSSLPSETRNFSRSVSMMSSKTSSRFHFVKLQKKSKFHVAWFFNFSYFCNLIFRAR